MPQGCQDRMLHGRDLWLAGSGDLWHFDDVSEFNRKQSLSSPRQFLIDELEICIAATYEKHAATNPCEFFEFGDCLIIQAGHIEQGDHIDGVQCLL